MLHVEGRAVIDRTRLAPSPTGALHLGNARTFLVNWVLARQQGWKILLRVEDLDGPRVKPETVRESIDILQWLGLDWDEGPVFQTHDLQPYRQALRQLAARGMVYPCRCTRRQILAASLSAPHGDTHELRYPGTCRPVEPTPVAEALLDDPECGWRLRVPEHPSLFDDQFLGPQEWHVQQSVGDFLVATKGGIPSYQLAVVVDDARQQVTCVVRGADLLSSVPRQQLIYAALELQPRPRYWHLPLVVGPDGRRLAKRHGDTRLSTFRAAGVSPDAVIGWLAHTCGVPSRNATGTMTRDEFRDRFDLAVMPCEWVLCNFRAAETDSRRPDPKDE